MPHTREQDAPALPALRELLTAEPAGDPTRTAVRRAAEAVVLALSGPRLSHDAVRRAVVRYGALARDLALDPVEMLAALDAAVRRGGERLAPGEQAHVQRAAHWWAIHGYHRAD